MDGSDLQWVRMRARLHRCTGTHTRARMDVQVLQSVQVPVPHLGGEVDGQLWVQALGAKASSAPIFQIDEYWRNMLRMQGADSSADKGAD